MAIMLLLSSVSTSSAQDATWHDGQRFSDWLVRCQDDTANDGRRCILVQEASLKVNEKAQRIMSTAIGHFGKDRRLSVLFTVPLGTFLPAGLMLKVDGHDETKRLGYQFCGRDGCRARFVLDTRWFALFKGGLGATVTMRMRGGKDVTVPLSLNGFTKGVEEAIGTN